MTTMLLRPRAAVTFRFLVGGTSPTRPIRLAQVIYRAAVPSQGAKRLHSLPMMSRGMAT